MSRALPARAILAVGQTVASAPAREGVLLVATVDAAFATAGDDPAVVVCDTRTGERPASDLRRLRNRYGRSRIVALIDAQAPLKAKWEVMNQGADDVVPLPQAVPPPELAARLASLYDPAFQRTRVLVVDDEPNNCELLEQELHEVNYDVVTAPDGPTALALVDQADLVLLDIMMPGMDGREVVKRLRASPDERVRSLPVVMLSALDQIKDKLHALEMGADDYVTKPYDADELFAKIRRLLWMRRVQGQFAVGGVG